MEKLIKNDKLKFGIIILAFVLFLFIVIENFIKFKHIDIIVYMMSSTIFLLTALSCKKKNMISYFEICRFISIVGYVAGILRLIKLFK